MEIKKILDKWICKSDYGETQYYYFATDNGNYCVSQCKHFNGAISYCLSDEKMEMYVSQEYIKEIYGKVENYDLQ